MQKTVLIDGKAVEFRSTAALPRLYRIKFGRDLFADIAKMQKALNEEQERQKAENGSMSQLPPDALFIFENLAYIMAKSANPNGVPDSVDEWLDSFETFSVYAVLPEILELWTANNAQISKPAKK